jgi:hypothetical protein
MKTEFSRQIFEKSFNITFHENPASERDELLHAGGRTHWQTDGPIGITRLIGRFSKFCEKLLKKLATS